MEKGSQSMTEENAGSYPGIDAGTPSVARVYDAFLGGENNFAVDRLVFQETVRMVPHARLMAVENRHWLIRAVRFLTQECGIDQFLDVGSGLPTRENTHQAVQRAIPDASVVYVDNDPACWAFGRALLEDNEFTHFVDADLTRPAELLAHPAITKHLDFDRSIALIQCATMHHVPDEQRPDEIMAVYRDALPSGSYLALTHFWDPEDGGPLTAWA